MYIYLVFITLTLLVRWQEWQPACQKFERWYVGGVYLTGALQILEFWLVLCLHLNHLLQLINPE